MVHSMPALTWSSEFFQEWIILLRLSVAYSEAERLKEKEKRAAPIVKTFFWDVKAGIITINVCSYPISNKYSLNSRDMIPGQVLQAFQIIEGKIHCTIHINHMTDPQYNQIHEIMRCFVSHGAHIKKASFLPTHTCPGSAKTSSHPAQRGPP